MFLYYCDIIIKKVPSMTKKVLYVIDDKDGKSLNVFGDEVDFSNLGKDGYAFKESTIDLKKKSINFALKNQDILNKKPEVIEIGELDKKRKVSGWYIDKGDDKSAKEVSSFLGGVPITTEESKFVMFERDRVVSINIQNYPHKRLNTNNKKVVRNKNKL